MARGYIPYRKHLTKRSQALRSELSRAERKLWYEFLRDLPVRFTRQKPLGSYIANFYCASQLLVIEIDGDSHYTERGTVYDDKRTVQLGEFGVRVIRFTNEDVLERFEGVCGEIGRVLRVTL